MKNYIKAGLAVMAVLVAAGSFAGEIKWTKSYNDALKAAAKGDKLIMIDFYTDWCTWCKKLDETTYKADVVTGESKKLVALKMDAEKEGKEQAARFHVSGYPTILFLSPKGDLVYKVVGYYPAEPFKAEMALADDVYHNLAKYESRYKANPDDVATAERLALIYAKTDKNDKAVAIVEQAEKVDPASVQGPLSEAYNALGNHYQSTNDYAKAIAMFEKADKTTKNDFTKVDSEMSLAQCYMSTKDNAKAATYLDMVMANPNTPDYYKKIAQSMLAQVKASKSG